MIHTLNNMYGHAGIDKFCRFLHGRRVFCSMLLMLLCNAVKIAIVAQGAYNAFLGGQIAIQWPDIIEERKHHVRGT